MLVIYKDIYMFWTSLPIITQHASPVACVCVLCNDASTNVVRIYSMLQFSSSRGHKVLGRPDPLLSILTFHRDVACADLRWFILATLTTPPPTSTREWATATMSFVIPHQLHDTKEFSYDTFQLNSPITQWHLSKLFTKVHRRPWDRVHSCALGRF